MPGKKPRGKIPGGFFLSGVDEGGFPGYVIEDQWFHTTREEWVFHASFSAAAGFTVCNFRNFVRGFGITSGWENRHRSQGFRYCAGRDIHSGSSARRPEKFSLMSPRDWYEGVADWCARVGEWFQDMAGDLLVFVIGSAVTFGLIFLLSFVIRRFSCRNWKRCCM